MNSEILAVQALKGDNPDEIDEAFCYLYEKYCKLIYTCIFAIVKDSRDAEELTNDTFVKVFNNRQKLCEQKNFKYYLVTVAKNLAIDFLKHKRITIVLDEEYIYNCIQSKKHEELVDIKNDLLEYLSQLEVEIILSHIIFGETFQEIASFYNLSIHTIKTKYFRALKKLQREMRDNLEQS